MKKLLFACVTLIITVSANAQVKKTTTTVKTVANKFGALAIDKSNGFYYGWSSDALSQAAAEKVALENCKKAGGNCSVVLVYSGTGCAAYRTVAGNVGTAYGWGIAKTKEEADQIARQEALKRSRGANPGNFVWACNSAGTIPLKVIKNEVIAGPVEGFNVRETKMGGLKSGDKIIFSSDRYYFSKELKPGELFLFHLYYNGTEGQQKDKYINSSIIVDKNGKQVTIEGEQFFEYVEDYLTYTINSTEGKDYKWALVTVKEKLRSDKRFGASFYADTEAEVEKAMIAWTKYPDEMRKFPENYSDVYNSKAIFMDKDFVVQETRKGWTVLQQNRYPKNYYVLHKTEMNTLGIK